MAYSDSSQAMSSDVIPVKTQRNALELVTALRIVIRMQQHVACDVFSIQHNGPYHRHIPGRLLICVH
jgi:hypothetical protein